MYKHHKESIVSMIAHYGQNPKIIALFLVGSIATGTERPDSDIDGIAVVTPDFFEEKKKLFFDENDKSGDVIESCFGKCTYDGGYFDIHYMTKKHMEELAENGPEPKRNKFTSAKMLFCRQAGLQELAKKIPVFQKQEAASKQLRFYCTLKQSYSYYWLICKPEGFMKDHIANSMVYNLYRLILIENEILFPSLRKLEACIINAFNKPADIVEKCQKFLTTLADEDALALIESFENWTSYKYPDPKEFQFIANNCINPWELY
ncbi:MAG: nucleotidyltransferase domain-containing protein [Treponema sp.]|nr:nucleotidyltransferase domain-containing protein [Treponema sp.]